MDAARQLRDPDTGSAVLERERVSVTSRLVAGIVDTAAHFSQWLAILAVLAALLLGGRWAASRSDLPAGNSRAAVDVRPVEDPGATDGGIASGTVPTPANGPTDGTSRVVGGPVLDSAAAEVVESTPGEQELRDAASRETASEPRRQSREDQPAKTHGGAAHTVLVHSTPPAARILVDGRELAERTPAPIPLRGGARLRLEAQGFAPFETTFQLDEGAPPARLSYRLTPVESTLRRVRAPADVPYPRPLRRVEPTLPAAVSETTSGIVVLALEIDAGGNVVDVAVLRGVSPPADRATVDAAWRWKFEPTVVAGRPVHVLGNFTVPVGRD